MLSTYKLNTRDIDPFIAALQSAYPNQEVEITVQEHSDETGYLFSDPANKAHLLQAVEDIRNGKNLVAVSIPDMPL